MAKSRSFCLVALITTTLGAFAQQADTPINKDAAIIRYAAQAEMALRKTEAQPKTIMGVLWLSERLDQKYEGLFRTFHNLPTDYPKIREDYASFDKAYDFLSGKNDLKVPQSSQEAANLFFDILIMTRKPPAVLTGAIGKAVQKPVFRLYESFENTTSATFKRRMEFLAAYKQAENEFPLRLSALIRRAKSNPELQRLLESTVYSEVGFAPNDSEDKRKLIVPNFYLLQENPSRGKELSDVRKRITAIEALIAKQEAAHKSSKKATSERVTLSPKLNSTVEKELKSLSEELPRIYNRQQDLKESLQNFRSADLLVSSVATFLRLGGYDDRNGLLRSTVAMAKAASKMSEISTNYISMNVDRAGGANNDVSSADNLKMSMDVLSTFTDLAVAMTPGASPEAQMLQAINQMLQSLKDYLEGHFGIVNDKLDRITVMLNEGFQNQAFLLQLNSEAILKVQYSLEELHRSLDRDYNLLLNAMEVGFDEKRVDEFHDCTRGVIAWTVCRDHLLLMANVHSSNELRTFRGDFRQLPAFDIASQAEKNVFKNAAFLEHVARSKYDKSSELKPLRDIPNPQTWAVSANQYLEVLELATPEEIRQERANITALLTTYSRFRDPVLQIFAKGADKENSRLNILPILANSYSEHFSAFRTAAKARIKDFCRAREINYLDVDGLVSAFESELANSQGVASTADGGKRVASHFKGITFPEPVKLQAWHVGRSQHGSDSVPEHLEALIDPKWLLAQRLGLVKVTPELLCMPNDRDCYFGVGMRVESVKRNDRGEPEFHGFVAFHALNHKPPEPIGGHNAKNWYCYDKDWTRVYRDFVKTGTADNFAYAKAGYDFHHARNVGIAEYLVWIWEVWPLAKPIMELDKAEKEWRAQIRANTNSNPTFPLFQIHAPFTDATKWEGLDYLRNSIEPELLEHFEKVFVQINEDLVVAVRSATLANDQRNEMRASAMLLEAYLRLGHSKSLTGIEGNYDAVQRISAFLASARYLTELPVKSEHGVPNFLSLIYWKHPEAWKAMNEAVQSINEESWQEPTVFTQLRRRLLALRESMQ